MCLFAVVEMIMKLTCGVQLVILSGANFVSHIWQSSGLLKIERKWGEGEIKRELYSKSARCKVHFEASKEAVLKYVHMNSACLK